LENIWKSIWNPPNEGFFTPKMGAFSGLKIYSCTVCELEREIKEMAKVPGNSSGEDEVMAEVQADDSRPIIGKSFVFFFLKIFLDGLCKGTRAQRKYQKKTKYANGHEKSNSRRNI
jgi:hypothetical protein